MNTGKRVKHYQSLSQFCNNQVNNSAINCKFNVFLTIIGFISGKEMVDYIADYLETIRERRVFPDVKPGYMRELVNDTAPTDGEDWDCIFKDVERVIMPGVGLFHFIEQFYCSSIYH